MGQEETKQKTPNEASPQKEIEKLTESLNQIYSELGTIKANIKKRKSEITTLKILFYTGLFVLLFGFIYTNQTLQRAQYNNLETNISALQNRINHTFLSLEKKVDEEIVGMEDKVYGNSKYKFKKSIEDMNLALNALRPETQKINKLIQRVQKDSRELSNMVLGQPSDKNTTPDPVP
tara:strand:+ start:500 stop:1030 length:531 start_codon:yes stop_codon:yes gene_type:complete